MSPATQDPKGYVAGMPVPTALKSLGDTIERSRWMLELVDNFDGEGSPAYSEETWGAAVTFLLRNAIALWEECHIVIDAPDVRNGPQGSIDIYWNTPSGRLLVNFPPKGQGDPSFYGSTVDGHEVKGTLSPNSENRRLILWQMGQK